MGNPCIGSARMSAQRPRHAGLFAMYKLARGWLRAVSLQYRCWHVAERPPMAAPCTCLLCGSTSLGLLSLLVLRMIRLQMALQMIFL